MKRLTTSHALSALCQTDSPFASLFSHGSLNIEIYKPQKVDLQQAHTRDELYVIASGSGYFINGDQRAPFETGEVLFVPAGTEHRFESFSEDFSTWVFFYGPEGGEAPQHPEASIESVPPDYGKPLAKSPLRIDQTLALCLKDLSFMISHP